MAFLIASVRSFRRSLLIGGLTLPLAICPPAKAQVNSNSRAVILTARLPESLTVSLTGGATVGFALLANHAANTGSTISTIRTAWVLQPGRARVGVWAWVPNAASALTDGAGDSIPARAVTAAATGSGSVGGILNSVVSGGAGVPAFLKPAAASGVQIGQVRITRNNRTGSTTTTLSWNIDTTDVPRLPAGTYTGTVNIQAQATP